MNQLLSKSIFLKNPKLSFPNQNPRPQTIEPASRIFNYKVPPPGQTLHLPCKANSTPDQVDSSLDLLISLKVPKSTRSDPFFFPVLFSLLQVYEMLVRPTLGLFSIETLLKLHGPLHCTAVHNFCQKRVFIIHPIQMLSYTKLYNTVKTRIKEPPFFGVRLAKVLKTTVI